MQGAVWTLGQKQHSQRVVMSDEDGKSATAHQVAMDCCCHLQTRLETTGWWQTLSRCKSSKHDWKWRCVAATVNVTTTDRQTDRQVNTSTCLAEVSLSMTVDDYWIRVFKCVSTQWWEGETSAMTSGYFHTAHICSALTSKSDLTISNERLIFHHRIRP